MNVPFVVRCAQCRQEVLDADLLGDEEECALRDHLLAVHPNTVQPETLKRVAQALRRHEADPAGRSLDRHLNADRVRPSSLDDTGNLSGRGWHNRPCLRCHSTWKGGTRFQPLMSTVAGTANGMSPGE